MEKAKVKEKIFNLIELLHDITLIHLSKCAATATDKRTINSIKRAEEKKKRKKRE